MADVDLAQFQFDYDLTWAAMFMNADGTVYGRFGTRSIEGAMAHISVDALKNAMSRALDLHRRALVFDAHAEGFGADLPNCASLAKRGRDFLGFSDCLNTTVV